MSKTPSKASPKADYQALQAELQAILTELQSDTTDVDTAMERYARGLQIVKELETYLKTAENTVKELKAAFDQQP